MNDLYAAASTPPWPAHADFSAIKKEPVSSPAEGGTENEGGEDAEEAGSALNANEEEANGASAGFASEAEPKVLLVLLFGEAASTGAPKTKVASAELLVASAAVGDALAVSGALLSAAATSIGPPFDVGGAAAATPPRSLRKGSTMRSSPAPTSSASRRVFASAFTLRFFSFSAADASLEWKKFTSSALNLAYVSLSAPTAAFTSDKNAALSAGEANRRMDPAEDEEEETFATSERAAEPPSGTAGTADDAATACCEPSARGALVDGAFDEEEPKEKPLLLLSELFELAVPKLNGAGDAAEDLDSVAAAGAPKEKAAADGAVAPKEKDGAPKVAEADLAI